MATSVVMPERPSPDLERMLTDVEWAMSKQFAARDLVPMLENLVRAAPAVSEAAYFAKLRLSELIVGDAPCRAARLARDVLVRGDSERAWVAYKEAECAYEDGAKPTSEDYWLAHTDCEIRLTEARIRELSGRPSCAGGASLCTPHMR